MADPTLTADAVNAAIRDAFPAASGGDCHDLGADFAVVRRAVDPGMSRPGGYVSGPTQFSVVDAALWYLVFGVVDRIELMALTSDVDITFLRPAVGTVVWGRAELLSAGRRKIVGSVRVWTDDPDRPTAVAKGAYMLPTN